MSLSLHADAERLETLMPIVLRVLHRNDPHDALAELSVAQLRILRILSGSPHTASAVGDILGLSVSAITQIVNRLEATGFVFRSDDESDRRIKKLALTDQGREILSSRRQNRVAQAELALSRLPATARRQLIGSLELLISQGHIENDERELTVVAELEHRLPPVSEPKS
jgi:DNA-binding MarR family transcriptional regulator